MTQETSDEYIDVEASARPCRVFVVLNPVAGVSDGSAIHDTIEKFCQSKGWECEIHETVKDEDLTHLMKKVIKDGTDMVIAAGGDGTISAVVGGIAGSGVPLGIIPAGTGNALARDLSIPLTVNGALDLLGGEHHIKPMDVMKIGKDYYVLNVSVGVSALMMKATGRDEKRRFGFLAYIVRGFQSLTRSHLHRFAAVVDGRKVWFSASEVFITNEKLMGLQPKIEGVEVSAEDGRLDLFAIHGQGFRDYLEVLSRFVFHAKSEYDSNLRYLPVEKEISLQSIRPIPVQADGEVIGHTPVQIQLVPHALNVIVPLPAQSKK